LDVLQLEAWNYNLRSEESLAIKVSYMASFSEEAAALPNVSLFDIFKFLDQPEY
jgi:hypothetical protein